MKRTTALVMMLVLIACSACAEDGGSGILKDSNCEALAALMNAEYPFEEQMKSFAEQYNGQTVEIDGFIYDGDFGLMRNIEICVGNYKTTYDPRPCFLLKNVLPEDLGFEGFDFPDFIEDGNAVRVVGRIMKYDDFDDGIVLEPISLEARNALLEDLDTGTYISLKKGSKGNDVKVLQQRLIDLYYLDGKADGSFGTKTKTAVEKFQAACNLEATGIADPATQAVLFSERAPEHTLSISCSSIVVGSSAKTVWYVDGQEFTLKGKQTKTINTRWGKYKFDASGNSEKIE